MPSPKLCVLIVVVVLLRYQVHQVPSSTQTFFSNIWKFVCLSLYNRDLKTSAWIGGVTIILMLFSAMTWVCWKERNTRIFLDKQGSIALLSALYYQRQMPDFVKVSMPPASMTSPLVSGWAGSSRFIGTLSTLRPLRPLT